MPNRLTSLRLLAAHPLPWVVVIGYFVVFLLLDWVSFIRPLQDFNITPWNPQPALAVALLLASRRLWWVVWASVLAADILVRGLPGDVFAAAAAAAALACGYLAIATALQRVLGDRWWPSDRRDVGWFIAIIAAGALLNGAVYVGTYAVAGFLPGRPLWEALARYWVGDTVGMVVALPLVLAAMDAERRAQMRRTLAHPHWWGIALAIGLLIWALFHDGDSQGLSFSYLLLLPVIWGAARFGAMGALASAAVTQVGLIVMVQTVQPQDLRVFELQILMATVTIAGLLLGVIVDQRERADAELRRSLRLAAAGQMSAALAHELSQPLTALATYAQACELLVQPGRPIDPERDAQLLGVSRRIGQDARRAGEVIRHLRDFFRSGATHLQRCELAPVIERALQAQSQRAQAAQLSLRTDCPQGLPAPWVDEVQLEVVLRNLLANAVDAALAAGPGGQVLVRASRRAAELLIEVIDSGAGVRAEQAGAIFEGDGSAKVGGMGVGLGICRAIVDAHGGRLWVVPGAQGHFCLALPIDATAAVAPPD